MSWNSAGGYIRPIIVTAVLLSGVFACDGCGSTNSEDESCLLFMDIWTEFHTEPPRPGAANGDEKPLSQQPRRFFSDRRVLELADAIKREDLDEIDRLLQGGVDVNARGTGGCTPLVWARVCRSPKSFSHLLENGADAKIRVDEYPLIYLLADTIQSGSEAYVKMLLQHGADPNAIYSSPDDTVASGETALFRAAMAGNAEIVRLLIKAKADMNRRSVLGSTALVSAVWHKQYQVVYELLKAGAKLDESPENPVFMSLARDQERNLPCLKDPWREKVIAWVQEHGYDLQPAIDRAKREEAANQRDIERNRRLWGDQDANKGATR